MSNESNNIVDLRAILFETMRKLKDGTINIENAKAVSDIGQVIINSAKVEVDAMRGAGIEGSGFIPGATEDRPGITRLPGAGIEGSGFIPGATEDRPGITRLPGKTIHKCK